MICTTITTFPLLESPRKDSLGPEKLALKYLNPNMTMPVFWDSPPLFARSHRKNNTLLSEKKTAKISLLHFFPELTNIKKNIDEITLQVEKALLQQSKIVVTPELSTSGFSITKEYAKKDTELSNIIKQLEKIKLLAQVHKAYVFIGTPIYENGLVYNACIIYGPSGLVAIQKKRGNSGWHDKNQDPIKILKTEFGNIAVLLCSDTYLPELPRIANFNGADILVIPSSWWSENAKDSPENIWKIRAQENGVWILAANRWGREIDDRYDSSYSHDMNTAPSAIISPNGTIKILYKKEGKKPGNRLLGTTIDLQPKKTTHSIVEFPLQKNSIDFFSPTRPRTVVLASAVYKPVLNFAKNIKTVASLIKKSKEVDLLVLPSFFMIGKEFQSINILKKNLSDIAYQYNISVIATELHILDGDKVKKAMIAVTNRGEQFIKKGAKQNPPSHSYLVLDTFGARVAAISGCALQYPETASFLARAGVDVILSPFHSADNDEKMPFGNKDDLCNLWADRTKLGLNIAISDTRESGGLFTIGLHRTNSKTASEKTIIRKKIHLHESRKKIFSNLSEQETAKLFNPH